MPGFLDDGSIETPPPSRSPSNGENVDNFDDDDVNENLDGEQKIEISCQKIDAYYYRMTCKSLMENFRTLDVVVTYVPPPTTEIPEPITSNSGNGENSNKTFFVMVDGMKDKLYELIDAMNGNYFLENCVIFDELSPGLPCAARYPKDNVWYRGQILANSQDGRCARVFFVDFGNFEDVSYENVQPLPRKFAELPILALQCRRADGSQLLNDALHQEFKMKIFGIESSIDDPIYVVDLWPLDENLDKNKQTTKKCETFHDFQSKIQENRSKIKQIYTQNFENDFRKIDDEKNVDGNAGGIGKITSTEKRSGGRQESYDPWWKNERQIVEKGVDGVQIPSTSAEKCDDGRKILSTSAEKRRGGSQQSYDPLRNDEARIVDGNFSGGQIPSTPAEKRRGGGKLSSTEKRDVGGQESHDPLKIDGVRIFDGNVDAGKIPSTSAEKRGGGGQKSYDRLKKDDDRIVDGNVDGSGKIPSVSAENCCGGKIPSTSAEKRRSVDQESYDPLKNHDGRILDGNFGIGGGQIPSTPAEIDPTARRKPNSKSCSSNVGKISPLTEFFPAENFNVANFPSDLENLGKNDTFFDRKSPILDDDDFLKRETKFEKLIINIAKLPCETDLSFDEEENFARKKALARKKPKLGKKGRKARRAQRQFLFSESETDEDDDEDIEEMYSYPHITSFIFSLLRNSPSLILDVGKNDFLDVRITHVEKANLFYARPDHLTDEFGILNAKLADYYGEKSTRLLMNDFRKGSFCINLIFDPSQIIAVYRCVVLEEINNQQVQIYFIDYGYHSTLLKSSLYRVPREFGRKPSFCIPFIIQGVHSCKPRVNRNFVEYLLKEEILCVQLLRVNKDSTALKVIAFNNRNENLSDIFLTSFEEHDYYDHDLH